MQTILSILGNLVLLCAAIALAVLALLRAWDRIFSFACRLVRVDVGREMVRAGARFERNEDMKHAFETVANQLMRGEMVDAHPIKQRIEAKGERK